MRRYIYILAFAASISLFSYVSYSIRLPARWLLAVESAKATSDHKLSTRQNVVEYLGYPDEPNIAKDYDAWFQYTWIFQSELTVSYGIEENQAPPSSKKDLKWKKYKYTHISILNGPLAINLWYGVRTAELISFKKLYTRFDIYHAC